MPYDKPPAKIKGLPDHAQKIWLNAFNSAYSKTPAGQDKDAYANATAWGAVKNAGYKKGKDGKWSVPKEAASTSSAGQLARPQVKESRVYTISSMREAQILDETKREIRVVIISEGKGNQRDKHYYTPEAIQSGIAAFEGAQCYADHPSRSQEADQPERKVEELVGYFKEAKVENIGGLSSLTAILKIMDGDDYAWAWQLAKTSIDYSKMYENKDFVGISINADGKTYEQELDGETWNFVKEFTDTFSADIVTKPARGGKFLQMMESMNKEGRVYCERCKSEIKKEEVKNMEKKQVEKMMQTLDGIKTKMGKPEEAKNCETDIDSLKSLLGQFLDDEAGEPAHAEDEGEAEGEAEELPPKKKPAVAAAPAEETEDEAETEAEKKEAQAMKARLALLESKEAMREALSEVDEELQNAGLPRTMTKHLKEAFVNVKKGTIMTKALRKATIDAAKKTFAELAESNPGGFPPKGANGDTVTKTVYDEMTDGL